MCSLITIWKNTEKLWKSLDSEKKKTAQGSLYFLISLELISVTYYLNEEVILFYYFYWRFKMNLEKTLAASGIDMSTLEAEVKEAIAASADCWWVCGELCRYDLGGTAAALEAVKIKLALPASLDIWDACWHLGALISPSNPDVIRECARQAAEHTAQQRKLWAEYSAQQWELAQRVIPS